MPRFFFDVNDGTEVRDEIGRDLEGVAFVRAEALQVASALLKAAADESREAALILSVRDVNADTLLRIRMVCQVKEL